MTFSGVTMVPGLGDLYLWARGARAARAMVELETASSAARSAAERALSVGIWGQSGKLRANSEA